MSLGKYHVVMKFGPGISGDEQAEAMMLFEKSMTMATGKPIQVFKETMADDSKLRSQMTPEQREKL